MNSRHREERKDARKKVKKFKIKRKTLETSSRIRKKKRHMKSDEKVFIRHLFDVKQ